jgi:hypothetical protein
MQCSKLGAYSYLICGGKQRRRDSEIENLCGLVVDDQLELGRLHLGQVRRLRALEDAPGVNAKLSIGISQVGFVADQAAGFDKLTPRIYCWEPGSLWTAAKPLPFGSRPRGTVLFTV